MKKAQLLLSFFCGKSRIRTCEGFPTDLQSVLVGRLSIFPTLGGERGIRTPGPVTVNGFQDRRIRPLCHFSLLTLFPPLIVVQI